MVTGPASGRNPAQVVPAIRKVRVVLVASKVKVGPARIRALALPARRSL
jgi:hypothetical protein